MRKKILSLLLILCLAISLLPVSASATGADDIIRIAQAEVGTSGRPNRYTQWCGRINGYGSNGYAYPWCSAFVGWVAAQAGESSAVPKTASVQNLASGILNAGGKRVDTPQAGDIVVYRRRSDNYYAHVGIMENSSTSIEGNYGNAVKRGINPKAYSYGGASVSNGGIELIYLRPNYKGSSASNASPSYSSCSTTIQTTAGTRVNLYDVPNGTCVTYLSKGQTVTAAQMAKLSNGATWYQVGVTHAGQPTKLWLSGASSGIKITDNAQPASQATAQAANRTPANLGNEFYAYIVNPGLGKYVSNDGSNVSSRSRYDTSSMDIWKQIWHFERLESGAYRITSAADNNSMDVQNFGQTSGTNTGMCNVNNSSAQQWLLYATGNSYNLRALCTSCYLDVSDNSGAEGQNIQMWEPNGTGAQIFDIEKVSVTKSVDIGNSFIARIYNPGHGTYLTNTENEKLVAAQAKYDSSQLWSFQKIGDTYKITSCLDGLSLDVYNNETAPGTPMIAYGYHGANNQKFSLFQENGGYLIKAASTNYPISFNGNTVQTSANRSTSEVFQILK